METQHYLNEIKVKLASSFAITSMTIVKERVLLDRGYFRARLTLINGDFLEVVEFFVVLDGRCYQWMDGAQQLLRKRWDNVEHFPNLPNFPHHLHVGEESNVEPSQSLSILELIDVIEKELST